MKAKFEYVGIRVKDIEKSVKFYTRVLGMKEVGRSRIDAAKGDIVNLKTADGGLVLELNHYDSDSPFNAKYVVGEGLDHIAFSTPDLEKALKEAAKAGFRVVERIRTKRSWWAYVEDPNGIWIELLQA